MAEPSERQREILDFIREYLAKNGVPPSLNEIAQGVGLSHRSTVHRHCQILVGSGWLEARQVLGATRYYPVVSSAAA